MGKPLTPRAAETIDVVGGTTGQGIGTTQPARTRFVKNHPSGDEAAYAAYFRYAGEFNASANGSGVVTDGQLKFLRALTVKTDKHKAIVNEIDGLGLHRIQSFSQGTRPATTAPATANDGATFDASFRIPFGDSDAIRPYDTMLDLIKSNLSVEAQFGIVSDVITGGTAPEVINLKSKLHWDVLPGPLMGDNETGELPKWMPSLEMTRIDINQTKKYDIELPSGEGVIKRIYLSQRDLTAGSAYQAEIATIITANSLISLRNNNYPVVDGVSFNEFQDRNKANYSLETMPTGWAVLDFFKQGRVYSGLSVEDTPKGKFILTVDQATAVTNGQLWIYIESVKPIPEAARR